MAAAKLGEFGRIARFFAPLAADYPGAFGLLDDAATLRPAEGRELVVTTDTIVAGVHFIGDELPGDIAAKLLRVNLSDIAAMGAVPLAYTLNIALPESCDDGWVADFANGFAADQKTFGIVLIGGDSVATPGAMTLTVTGFGEVPVGQAIRRNGAGPDDRVFASGTIGDGALGLRAARNLLPDLPAPDLAALLARYRRPEPRTTLGEKLLGLASAAADVSDGLVADLGHIAGTSGTGAEIDASAVPLSGAARAALEGDPQLLPVILTGGDDYELVFTVPAEAVGELAAISTDTGVPITEIGRIVRGSGVRVLDGTGRPMALPRSGYAHG